MGMKQDPCPRCGRWHRGICGIPPRVAQARGLGASSVFPIATKTRVRARKPTRKVLEGLLTKAKSWEATVLKTLQATPPALEEYNMLVDRLEKLQHLIQQVNVQIAARR